MRILFSVLLVLFMVFGFYEGRKAYWDYRVGEMCKTDGGIRVNFLVSLPAGKFNEWGQPNFYRPTEGENSLGPEYIFRSETTVYRDGNPRVARYHIQVIRRSDNSVLGESISYGRGGGDLPSPSYGSSYHCPNVYGDIPLLKRIFVTDPKQGIKKPNQTFQGTPAGKLAAPLS